jgi:hypothetical protein
VTLVVTADLRKRFGLQHLEPRTETTMTEERMALIELVEKQADGDLVREILAFAAECIMEAEVEARTGATKGARSPLREVQRSSPCSRSATCSSCDEGCRHEDESVWKLRNRPIDGPHGTKPATNDHQSSPCGDQTAISAKPKALIRRSPSWWTTLAGPST